MRSTIGTCNAGCSRANACRAGTSLAQAVFLGGGDAQAATQFAMLGAGVVDGQARLVEHLHAALVEAFASIGQAIRRVLRLSRETPSSASSREVEADYRTRLAEGVGGGAEEPQSTTARKVSKRSRLTMEGDPIVKFDLTVYARLASPDSASASLCSPANLRSAHESTVPPGHFVPAGVRPDLVNIFIASVAYPDIGRSLGASVATLAWIGNTCSA